MNFGLANFLNRPAVAVAAAVLAMGSVAGAAIVHNNGLPSAISTFNKTTNAYMYLEGETALQSSTGGDTFANTADASGTFFRTGANPSEFWGASQVYDGARYAGRGADSSTSTNVNAYWENLATGLVAGQYDVFVRAYQSSNGRQTYTLYAGADRSAVDDVGAVAVGTVSTPVTASPAAAWYKIGSVNVTSATDTFRLRLDTSTSTIRFDTLLFAGPVIPEPATGLLAAAGFCMLLGRRRLSAARVTAG